MDLRAEYLPLVVVLIFTCCSNVEGQNQATCDGMDDMIERSTALSCTKTPACNRADCTPTSLLLRGYSLSIELLSCRTPPGVRLIVSDSRDTLYDGVVDETVRGIAVGVGTLTVTLDQLEGAVGLRIRLRTILGTTDIVPYSRLPLDTQSCTPTTTEAPSTDTPSPNTPSPDTPSPNTPSPDTPSPDTPSPDTPSPDTPSPDTPSPDTPTSGTPTEANTTAGPYGPTCDGLDRLTMNVNQMSCVRNEQCDTADCTITNPSFSGTTLSLTLLPCRVPRPGVRLIARDSQGELLIDRVVDESQRNIELSQGALLDITLDQLGDSIGLSASVRVDGIPFSIPILTYTTVPLDRRSCPPEGTTATLPTSGTSSEAPTTDDQTPTTGATTDQTPTTGATTDQPPTTGATTDQPPTTGATTDQTPTTGATPDQTPTTGVTTDQSPTTDATTDQTPTTGATTDQTPTTGATTDQTPTTGATTDQTPTTGVTIDQTPTDSDEKNTTCAVLARLAEDAELFKCTADSTEPCDTVSCSYLGYSTVMVLLPCVEPAAIRLVISQGELVVLNRTVDHSQQVAVPELLGLVLNVSLDHFDDAIGLEVIGILGTDSSTIVKYTVIPLEREKTCEGSDGPTKATDPVTKESGSKEPSVSPTALPRSAGITLSFSWPLLLLSLITFTLK